MILEDADPLLARINFAELKGKSLVVTGATGLLGIWLLACLRCAAGRGTAPAAVHAVVHSDPLPFFRELADAPFIHLAQGNLVDFHFTEKLPPADYIVHAAGYGQPGRFLEKPDWTLMLNTAVTQQLLARLKPGGKFLFVSSAEVYSGLQVPPHKETEIGTTNTTHPRSCYIEGKRGGEAICQAWRTRGVPAKSARLALAYGPGARRGDARVLNSFIEKGLEGKIALMDGGQARRTYCYITDAIEILWRILLDGRDPIYNVGGISRTTIADLARTIGRLVGVPVVFPDQTQALSGAPEDVRLDMAKVENEFGKRDFVPLEEGLKRTVEWQKAFRSMK